MPAAVFWEASSSTSINIYLRREHQAVHSGGSNFETIMLGNDVTRVGEGGGGVGDGGGEELMGGLSEEHKGE